MLRPITWKIDSDDVDVDRSGYTSDAEPAWNGFDVVYVTPHTLQTFARDNGGQIIWETEGAIVRWPDSDSDDDLLAAVPTEYGTLYSLHGWCVTVNHTHAYRADLAAYICNDCGQNADTCTQAY